MKFIKRSLISTYEVETLGWWYIKGKARTTKEFVKRKIKEYEELLEGDKL